MAKVVKSDDPFRDPARIRQAEKDRIRATTAKVVRIVCLVFALVLALAAFLVGLGDVVSHENPVVKAVLNVADAIDGPFSPDGGVFAFDGKNAETKNAVVNWGIAAICWLAIGRLAQRLLAPRSSR